MKRIVKLAACAAGLSVVAACATANYSMTPVATTGTTVTYEQGTPIVGSDTANAAVKVTPMGINGGGFLKVAVAVINKSGAPSNLGIENVSITDEAGNDLHVYTTTELTRIAKQRAARAELAIAIIGGIAAAADNASSYQTTRGYVGNTPVYMSTYDPVAANIAMDRDSAQTSAAMGSVNQQLSGIIDNLHDSALQTTTVNPSMGYGGLVWAAPPKNLADAKGPVTVTVVVTFAGEPHKFQFELAKS